LTNKNANYVIGGNHIHYETNTGKVRVADDSNTKDFGTLNDFFIQGKNINGSTVTNIKTSGMYYGTNIHGLPSEFAADKICILSVKAVGPVGAPTLTVYQVFNESGVSAQMVVKGSSAGSWSNGGKLIDNALNSIGDTVGNLSGLQTDGKGSIVDAINSLKNSASKGLDLNNNSPIRMKTTSGSYVNFGWLGTDNTFHIGDGSQQIAVAGKDLTFNGAGVVTSAMYGHGKGINADMVDGKHANAFAATDVANTYTADQVVTNGHNLGVRGQTSSLVFQADNGSVQAKASVTATNDLVIQNGGKNAIYIKYDGSTHTWGGSFIHEQTGSKAAELTFMGNAMADNKGAFSIQRTATGDVRFYRPQDGNDYIYLQQSDSSVEFPRAIWLQGRRLYMQSAEPTGAGIPEGSVWFS
jgi:hypothetical protein